MDQLHDSHRCVRRSAISMESHVLILGNVLSFSVLMLALTRQHAIVSAGPDHATLERCRDFYKSLRPEQRHITRNVVQDLQAIESYLGQLQLGGALPESSMPQQAPNVAMLEEWKAQNITKLQHVLINTEVGTRLGIRYVTNTFLKPRCLGNVGAGMSRVFSSPQGATSACGCQERAQSCRPSLQCCLELNGRVHVVAFAACRSTIMLSYVLGSYVPCDDPLKTTMRCLYTRLKSGVLGKRVWSQPCG